MRLATESPAWLLPPGRPPYYDWHTRCERCRLKPPVSGHTHTHNQMRYNRPPRFFPSVTAVCRIYSPSICLCQGKTGDLIVGDTKQSSRRRAGWSELIHSSRDWHKCSSCSFQISKFKTFKGAGNYRVTFWRNHHENFSSQLLKLRYGWVWHKLCGRWAFKRH